MKHLKYLGLGFVSSNGWAIMIVVLFLMDDMVDFLIALSVVVIISYFFGLYNFREIL